VRLEVVAGDEFEESEDAGDEDSVFPPVEDGDGEEKGRGGGDGDSDVGDEAAECSERSE